MLRFPPKQLGIEWGPGVFPLSGLQLRFPLHGEVTYNGKRKPSLGTVELIPHAGHCVAMDRIESWRIRFTQASYF